RSRGRMPRPLRWRPLQQTGGRPRARAAAAHGERAGGSYPSGGEASRGRLARLHETSQLQGDPAVGGRTTTGRAMKGSPSAPYINRALLPITSHAEQYYNPPNLHPSLPNQPALRVPGACEKRKSSPSRKGTATM